MSFIQSLDSNLLLNLQSAFQSDFMDSFMLLCSKSCDYGIFWIVLVLLLIMIRPTRRNARIIAISMVICIVVNNVLLKNAVARARPYEVVEGVRMLLDKPPSGYTFPSGHACVSFAAAVGINCMYGKRGMLAYIPAVLISFSRIYVGAHYPGDVLAGALIGTLGSLSICLPLRVARDNAEALFAGEPGGYADKDESGNTALAEECDISMTNSTVLTLQWLGHSCFKLTGAGYTLVLDPYNAQKIPGLSALDVEADGVLCSHGHFDHAFTEAVRLRDDNPADPFTVTELEIPHDDKGGELRGMNTMRIFEFGGLRAAHLGDIGVMPDDAQLEVLSRLDLVMIPVGGFFTIDAVTAKALVDRISPRVIVPMHYRTESFGLENIGTLEEFTSLCDNVVYHGTDTLLIDETTTPQVAVLKCLP